MKSIRGWVALLAMALFAAACTSIYQVRGTEQIINEPIPINEFVGDTDSHRALQMSMEHQSVERFENFSVGVIELTDDGGVNPAQKQQVMDMVKDETSEGGLLVVFAHGWHHSARACDRDLACFRTVLARLATARRRQGEDGKVVGVYIGWRGESLSRKGFNLATIWDRKRVAEHIGRTSGKEILIELHQHWTQIEKLTMVTVGHSLGGALVFSAVKGRLTGNVSDILTQNVRTFRVPRTEAERSEALKRNVKALRAGFGDLVVLVNPAIEASEYRAFDNDLIDNGAPQAAKARTRKGFAYDKAHPYDRRQLPVLMVVASTADTAVGNIFPFARAVGALGTGRFKYLVSDADLQGMGRYVPQVTHELTYPPMSKEELRRTEKEEIHQAELCGCSKRTEFAALNIEGTLELDGPPTQHLGDLTFSLTENRQERGWDKSSPYIVVQANKGVIREHSDIFNPVFVTFLMKYIYAYEKKQEKYDISGGIAGIQAVDVRFHGVAGTASPAARNRKAPIGEPLFPERLQFGRQRYLEAWSDLYGDHGEEVENDHVRSEIKAALQKEQGTAYSSWILDRVGVEYALVDEPSLANLDPSRFRWIAPAHLLAAPSSDRKAWEELVRQSGRGGPPASLEDYVSEVIEPTLRRWKEGHAVALRLRVASEARHESLDELRRIYRDFAAGTRDLSADEAEPLEDFLVRRIAHLAGNLGLVVHVEAAVGALDSGAFESILDDADLRNTRFVLAQGDSRHGTKVLDLLARPNLYVELSDELLQERLRDREAFLRSLLQKAPDQILFGSNAGFDPQARLGGWEEREWLLCREARTLLAETLSLLLEEEALQPDEALRGACKVLRGNAMALYGLGGKGDACQQDVAKTEAR